MAGTSAHSPATSTRGPECGTTPELGAGAAAIPQSNGRRGARLAREIHPFFLPACVRIGAPAAFMGMEIAKALLLAGRTGDSPWPVAAAAPKVLVPIANRPIIFHNLEALRGTGVLEVTILAAPGTGAAIERAVGDGRDWDLNVRYAEWDPEDGVTGALAVGHTFLRGEPVLVLEGDAVLRDRMHRQTAAFAREGLDAMALQLRDHAGAASASAPGYLLSPRAVGFLLEAEGSEPGCPMAGVEARGGRVRVEPVDGILPCHGSQELLLDGNRRMLERLEPSVDPESVQDCRIQGAVEVHPSARISRSLLRGPLIVGPDARVKDAYIGPYTSIGARVCVEGTEVEHSIVLSDAELRFVGTRLESSIIGRGARVVRGFELPGAMQMSVGEGAVVILR